MNLQMLSSSSTIASPPPINGGRSRVLFPSGFSLGFPSAPRKLLPLKCTLYPIDKDVAHPMPKKIETDSKSDDKTPSFKNPEALESIFNNMFILNREASSGAVTSSKAKNSKKLAAAQSTNPEYLPIIRYPLTTEAAIKAILERNTLGFVVDKRADKNIIKDTFGKTFQIKAKKVNTSIMPDGTKKAFIMLAPECNALDMAKKIGIL